MNLAEILAAVAAVLLAVAGLVKALRTAKAAPHPPPAPPPVITPPRDPSGTLAPVSRPSRSSLRRILVVDDEPGTRVGVRRLLEQALPDVAVDEAESGDAAVEALASKPCDLVILDVSMSGLSGQDVARHVREAWPSRHIPIVLYSGLDAEALERIRAASGADAVVVKEGDSGDVLIATARRLLARE